MVNRERSDSCAPVANRAILNSTQKYEGSNLLTVMDIDSGLFYQDNMQATQYIVGD